MLLICWLVEKLPEFCGTQRFTTVFTRACHFSLSWARWIQLKPFHPISVTHILTSLSHFCFGFPDPGWICIHPEVGEGNGRTYPGGLLERASHKSRVWDLLCLAQVTWLRCQIILYSTFWEMRSSYEILVIKPILRSTCRKWEGVVGTGWSWLRTGTGMRAFVNTVMNSRVR